MHSLAHISVILRLRRRPWTSRSVLLRWRDLLSRLAQVGCFFWSAGYYFEPESDGVSEEEHAPRRLFPSFSGCIIARWRAFLITIDPLAKDATSVVLKVICRLLLWIRDSLIHEFTDGPCHDLSLSRPFGQSLVGHVAQDFASAECQFTICS